MKSTFLLILLATSAYTLPGVPGNFSFPLTVVKGAGHAGAVAAQFLRGRDPKPPTSSLGQIGHHVMIEVGVGSPTTTHQILFDTGSAITWL